MATDASKAIALTVYDPVNVTALYPLHSLRIFSTRTLAKWPHDGQHALRISAHDAQLLPWCRFAGRQRLVGIFSRKH